MEYTIYVTYSFGSSPYSGNTSLGYSNAIHCNYIQKITTDVIENKDISINFYNENDFKFMSTNISDGIGWSATNMYIILQIVENNNEPQSNMWRIIDVTNQLSGHTENSIITPNQIIGSVLKVSLNNITSYDIYNLDYLSYPSSLANDDDKLSFGEEYYFLGNVKTKIEAIAYTTEISINLSLNEFNSTTNPTWDKLSSVQISEVGIYDDDNNLVAIGKLNNPISKDGDTSRTIIFEMDF